MSPWEHLTFLNESLGIVVPPSRFGPGATGSNTINWVGVDSTTVLHIDYPGMVHSFIVRRFIPQHSAWLTLYYGVQKASALVTGPFLALHIFTTDLGLGDPSNPTCHIYLFIVSPQNLWGWIVTAISQWHLLWARKPGILLSCWDPCPIAKISSNPRLIPYCSPDSVLTILRDSDTMLTKPPNSKHPPRPPTHYHRSLRTLNDLQEPQSHFCLHLSLSFHFSPLELWSCFHIPISVFTFPFWYIKPFQYSCSLILAPTLPLYISASLLLNSSNPL